MSGNTGIRRREGEEGSEVTDGLGRGDTLSAQMGEVIHSYECCADISIFSPLSFGLVGKLSMILSL